MNPETDCNICFTPIDQSFDWEDPDNAYHGSLQSAPCIHKYHLVCLAEALKHTNKCPTCKESIPSEAATLIKDRSSSAVKHIKTYIKQELKNSPEYQWLSDIANRQLFQTISLTTKDQDNRSLEEKITKICHDAESKMFKYMDDDAKKKGNIFDCQSPTELRNRHTKTNWCSCTIL